MVSIKDDVTYKQIGASVKAGENAFDLVISQDRVIVSGGLAGYFLNLLESFTILE